MMKPDGEYVFSEIAFPPFALIMSFNAEPVRKSSATSHTSTSAASTHGM